MNLDINTPRGQVSLQQERVLLDSARAAFPGVDFIETDKTGAAQVDGVMVKDNVVVGVYESKCRNLTKEQMHRYGDEWLVTYEKILGGIEVSKRLRVPFYGFIYFTREPIGAFIKIADEEGNILPQIRVAHTVTQMTVNGGSIIRENAYIDLSSGFTFPIRI
jgi:hypothetical protein